jgi:hypothetical protein
MSDQHDHFVVLLCIVANRVAAAIRSAELPQRLLRVAG